MLQYAHTPQINKSKIETKIELQSLPYSCVCLFVGAFIFLSIESEQNHFAAELNGTMIAYRANLTAQLWEITMTVNTFERDKYLSQ